MKKLYLIIIACYSVAVCCFAQPNQPLTNDVAINEWGTRLILMSFASVAASSNNILIGDKELQADQPNFWMLHNPSSDRGALLPNLSNGGCFVFELKTTNGISMPKTEMGEKMIARLKSLTNKGNSHFHLGGTDFPALTNLFSFPSNGVYIFELRCWAWQNSKKQFVLSDPIRVRVIKENTNSPSAYLPLNVQTNPPAK